MKINWFGGIVVSVLFLVASSHAAGPYIVTDLGDLGAGESRAYALNASGQVVGWSSMWDGGYHRRRAFLYSGGVMQDLGTLGGGDSEAMDINDAGEVVGKASVASGQYRAFFYTGGSMTELDPFAPDGGWTGAAYGINDANQVVGTSAKKVTILYRDHAFRWTDGDDDGLVGPGEVLELLALNGQASSTSQARDVNDAGQVVGYSPAGIYNHAFFFHDAGGMVDLGTFGGNVSEAYAINQAGQVVGGSQTSDPKTHAFLWSDQNGNWAPDPGETIDLGAPVGGSSRAHGINASGDIVGYAQDPAPTTWAFLYTGGAMLNLNDLVGEPFTGWELQEAWDINDSGQIVGLGKNPANMTHGFLLTPVFPGDANYDGTVDGLDYVAWSNHYGQAGGWMDGNFNADGVVDGLDYIIWSNNYQASLPGAAMAVPEPSSALLIVLGVWALRRRLRGARVRAVDSCL